MLDHGILNVPLSKRGNIDAQIDKYKAEQAAIKKTGSKAAKAIFNDNKEIAKELWNKVDKDLIKQDAKKRGVKFSELRDVLHDFVKWQPHKAIKVLPDYINS
ncbi:hypothetical protein [Providencia alcalifaciens]|uniref:hypothetical protein n=1 Tax=Providencia alcalifaciens TaxID=126385 RepID=UPI000D8A8D3D|nr:hypothetical protein [Providencia alcalifaciens]MTC29187.1 hypothetical protein [Providencia alcalifaciens]SPY71509.1 Uncharacterised protein [Providencia alcalifaciens]